MEEHREKEKSEEGGFNKNKINLKNVLRKQNTSDKNIFFLYKILI